MDLIVLFIVLLVFFFIESYTLKNTIILYALIDNDGRIIYTGSEIDCFEKANHNWKDYKIIELKGYY